MHLLWTSFEAYTACTLIGAMNTAVPRSPESSLRLLDWVVKGTTTSWLPNHLNITISQSYRLYRLLWRLIPGYLNVSQMPSFGKSRKAEPPRSSSKQDMRKQRQRIHEQQIMHYFVQILQANFDAKSTFQLAVYHVICVCQRIFVNGLTFKYRWLQTEESNIAKPLLLHTFLRILPKSC